jgi:hypothetical protein
VAVSLPEAQQLLVFDGDLAAADTVRFMAPPGDLAFGPDGAGIALLLELGPGKFSAVLVPRRGGFTSVSAPFAGGARQLVFSRGGGELYLLVAGARGGLSVVDLATLAERRRLEVCPDPLELGLMRDGRRAFILCRPGEIAEIDLALGILVRKEPLEGSCGARSFFLSSSETALLVWCAAGKLLFLDRVSMVPFDSLAGEPGEAMLVALRGGRTAGVIYRDPPRIALIDVSARRFAGGVSLQDTVGVVAVSAGGRFLYLAAGGRLLRLDVSRVAIDRSAKLQGRPAGLALWPGDWESRLRWFFR